MRPLRRRSCAFPPMRLLYMPPRNDTLPRPDNVTSDRRTRTTPFPPTLLMRPLRRRSCVPSGNAPASQGRYSSRAQRMQPQTVAQGQRRSRQLRQCVRCACRPRTTLFPPTLLMRPLRRRSCASRQCACRTRTTQLPRPENAAADSHVRTTPFPPTLLMRPLRRRSCASRQCACCTCRPGMILLPRPENAAADRRPRTTPSPRAVR